MKKIDRRIQRTQEALLGAMVELILEKGFSATNVQEICERANIGRSTFYVHYADKEDLMQGSAEGLGDFLEKHVNEANKNPNSDSPAALAFCLPMMEHAAENKKLFSALVGRKGGYLFQELVHEVWTGILRRQMGDVDEIIVQSIAGAFGSTLTWWLTQQPELPAEVVAKGFVDTIRPLLDGLQYNSGM